MNIIISGAFGFVGSNLSTAIKSTFKHYLIAIDIIEIENHIFDEYHSWNDLEKVDLNKVNTIIHLAGKAHDTRNTTEEKVYFDINVGLTKKIFECFLKSSASKFIFFSSVKAVADSVTGDLLTEEALANPKTPYGRSKLEAEKYILNEWEKWKVDEVATRQKGDEKSKKELLDKKVYILRPCMIHGSGNKGNLNLLFNIQQKGLPWPLGAFENRRSFCSIDNVSFVIQQLIENDIESGIYQIADDEPLSTNRIIALMAESQNKKARIWRIPVQLIKTIAQLGDFLHLPLNSERLRKLTESYIVSNQKIKNALNIEKMPVSAHDGLIKTFKSFQK